MEIPHGEFCFCFDQKQGFQISQLDRHVSVTAFDGRMLLWAGYHCSYARTASMKPDAKECSLLVALTTDGDFFLSKQSSNQGLQAIVRDLRRPLFRNFFDDALFMRIKLCRKCFELQIRAKVVSVNDDS